MKKTIKVIIKDKNSKLGKINTIKLVSLGYAFNYLIPNQLVEIATKGRLKHIRMLKKVQSEQENIIYNNNLEIKDKLDKIQKINIRKKLGPNQQIFGRITENDIIEQLAHLTSEKINKKQIKMPNIKEIGIYNIHIKIAENLSSNIKLHILPNNL
uniref:50S ribosomal protein L9, chloroplastic n=1 Tax=Synarthrophyton chejuense TaxID=2485825 RepID=A0A3G3MFT8_9FLOR|nr:ribosomal protein L9 [Synarthrophyton chejuense]AYR05691.1 ribosomal protein L9 [Synarthrophyton chejuense]